MLWFKNPDSHSQIMIYAALLESTILSFYLLMKKKKMLETLSTLSTLGTLGWIILGFESYLFMKRKCIFDSLYMYRNGILRLVLNGQLISFILNDTIVVFILKLSIRYNSSLKLLKYLSEICKSSITNYDFLDNSRNAHEYITWNAVIFLESKVTHTHWLFKGSFTSEVSVFPCHFAGKAMS